MFLFVLPICVMFYKIKFTDCNNVTNEFEILFCFIGISILSLRILSFHNNTSLLFINKCIILYIMFPERDAEIRVLNYFTLPLPTQAVDSIIDMQLCRGILFVLSSLGWICILGGKNVDVQGRWILRKINLFRILVLRNLGVGWWLLFVVKKLFREKDLHELNYIDSYSIQIVFIVYIYVFHNYNHLV